MQSAKTQHRFTLLYKALYALRDYRESRMKSGEAKKLVGSFYKCLLAGKALKALKEHN